MIDQNTINETEDTKMNRKLNRLQSIEIKILIAMVLVNKTKHTNKNKT